MLQSTASMMPISYESTSSEEQMLQMFNQPPVLNQQSQQHQMIEQQCSSTETICAKPAPYSPRSPNGSSSGVEEDEEEPRRKRVGLGKNWEFSDEK